MRRSHRHQPVVVPVMTFSTIQIQVPPWYVSIAIRLVEPVLVAQSFYVRDVQLMQT